MRNTNAQTPAPLATKFYTRVPTIILRRILVRHTVLVCDFMKLTTHMWFRVIFTFLSTPTLTTSMEHCRLYMVRWTLLNATRFKKNHGNSSSGWKVINFLVKKMDLSHPIFGSLKMMHTPYRFRDVRKTWQTHAHNIYAPFDSLGSKIRTTTTKLLNFQLLFFESQTKKSHEIDNIDPMHTLQTPPLTINHVYISLATINNEQTKLSRRKSDHLRQHPLFSWKTPSPSKPSPETLRVQNLPGNFTLTTPLDVFSHGEHGYGCETRQFEQEPVQNAWITRLGFANPTINPQPQDLHWPLTTPRTSTPCQQPYNII